MRGIVVVGGSLAGHRAAQALRGIGYDGELTVIGSESHRPYGRFPLSKAFLTRPTDRGGLELDGAPADVVWRLGETATQLDLAGRQVMLGDRTALRFDGLVVASGARPGMSPSSGVCGERSCFARSRTPTSPGPSWSAGPDAWSSSGAG